MWNGNKFKKLYLLDCNTCKAVTLMDFWWSSCEQWTEKKKLFPICLGTQVCGFVVKTSEKPDIDHKWCTQR